jgi:hypothetical protein
MQIALPAFLGKYAPRLLKTFGSLKVTDVGDLSADEVKSLVEVCRKLGIDIAEKYESAAPAKPAPKADPFDLVAARAAKVYEASKAVTNESKEPEANLPAGVAKDPQTAAQEKPKRGRKPKA